MRVLTPSLPLSFALSHRLRGRERRWQYNLECSFSISSPVWFPGPWSLFCFFILQSLQLAFLKLQPRIPLPDSLHPQPPANGVYLQNSEDFTTWEVLASLSPGLAAFLTPLLLRPDVLSLLPGHCHGPHADVGNGGDRLKAFIGSVI